MLAVDALGIIAATGIVAALATAVFGVFILKSSEWVPW
jgi:hypothetical protein